MTEYRKVKKRDGREQKANLLIKALSGRIAIVK